VEKPPHEQLLRSWHSFAQLRARKREHSLDVAHRRAWATAASSASTGSRGYALESSATTNRMGPIAMPDAAENFIFETAWVKPPQA
jgi:hypothetical protein